MPLVRRILASLFLVLGATGVRAQSAPETALDHVRGQALLKSNTGPGADEAALLARHELEVVYRYRRLGALLVGFAIDRDARVVVGALQRDTAVAWAHVNALGRRSQSLPNDPSFGLSWALHNGGQIVNGDPGTADSDVDAPEAWDLRTDATNAPIAIVDSGCRLTHQDLATSLWTNVGEIPANGVDDDANGFIDDVQGWDFLGNDATPQDVDGHGTAVTGIACMSGNDGVGLTGVCWQSRAMILKDGNAIPQVAWSAAAVEYAAMNGARVCNFSTVYPIGPLPILEAAFDLAEALDMLVCCAAGNSATDLTFSAQVPATYLHGNLVVVAASDNDDLLAPFTNYGALHVDVAAPGISIASAHRAANNAYAFYTGTSFATPLVSGCAALARAHAPQASAAAIRRALMLGCDVKAAFTGFVGANGRVNARTTLDLLERRPGTPRPPAVAGITNGGFTIAGVEPPGGSGFEYAMRLDSLFIDPWGGLVPTPVWRRSGDWVGVAVDGLAPDTIYALGSRARTALGVESDWSASTPVRTDLLGACAAGVVGIASGGPFDVLFLDGEAGGSRREVCVAAGAPFLIEVMRPPTNPQPADFALLGRVGIPTAGDSFGLPANLGTLCFTPCEVDPTQGSFTIVSSFGPGGCSALAAASAATWVFLSPGAPIALPPITLQPVIVGAPGQLAVGNAIVLRIE